MATNSSEVKKKVQLTMKRHQMLVSRMSQFYSQYEDLANIMHTNREGFITTQEAGSRRNDDIFDGTPMQAARSLANTFGAMIRPDGEAFTTVKLANKNTKVDEAGRDWLADTTERLDTAIRTAEARFKQSAGEVDLDLVVFGTGILSVGLNSTRDNMSYRSVHLKDGVPFFNKEGKAVGMFELHTFKLWQLVDKFPLNKLHDDTIKKIKEDKLDDEIKVLHAVIPREDRKFRDPLLARNFPWTDMWIEQDKDHLIEDGGFREFPFVVPRWSTTSGEDMGRSPGMVALPDSSTLQAMGETILIAGQRSADPPLMAPNDGGFSEINAFPGGISYYDVETATSLGGNPFFPLASGTNLAISRDMQQDTRAQVLNAFFKNVLNLPLNGPQMTATEVMQRKDEFIREVGAVFGAQETDYNLPIAERTFNTMLRENGFMPIPPSLEGQNIKYQFELPADKVKKQIKAMAARQWAMTVLETAEFDPASRHLVNFEGLARFEHDANGLPHEIINSEDHVKKKLQADQEATRQMEEQAQTEAGLQQAATGAKAMKDLGVTEPVAQEQ